MWNIHFIYVTLYALIQLIAHNTFLQSKFISDKNKFILPLQEIIVFRFKLIFKNDEQSSCKSINNNVEPLIKQVAFYRLKPKFYL